MKERLLKFFTHPIVLIIGLLCSITGYTIKDLITYKFVSVNIWQFLSQANWIFVIGQIIIVASVYATVRKYSGIKQSIINELRPSIADLTVNVKDYNTTSDKRIKEIEANFKKLSNDMASFAHYQQGLICISGKDSMGAYFNFVHAIKFSIEGDNLQNLPRIFKMIMEQILPNFCKGDIESIKKDKMLDIEDAFRHIASVDENKVFAMAIQDVRAAINRLPQAISVPTLEDILPEKTFIDIDTEKGRARVNLIAIRQAFNPFESQLNEMLLHNKNVFNGLQRSFYIILYKQDYRITCLKNKEEGSRNGEIKYVSSQLYATATQDAPIMAIKESLAHYYNMTVKDLEIIIANLS